MKKSRVRTAGLPLFVFSVPIVFSENGKSSQYRTSLFFGKYLGQYRTKTKSENGKRSPIRNKFVFRKLRSGRESSENTRRMLNVAQNRSHPRSYYFTNSKSSLRYITLALLVGQLRVYSDKDKKKRRLPR